MSTTNDRNVALIIRAQAGDVAARNEVIEINMPLIRKMIDKATRARGQFEEHLAIATMAMVRTIESFDPSRGYAFSTYACSAIIRAVRESIVAGKVISPKRYENLKRCPVVVSGEALHFDRPRKDSTPNQYAKLEASTIFQKFTEREKKIVVLWLRGETLECMGDAIDVTKERARQLLEKALGRVRRQLSDCPDS